MLPYFIQPSKKGYQLYKLIPVGMGLILFSKIQMVSYVLFQSFSRRVILKLLLLLGIRYGYNYLDFAFDKYKIIDKLLIGIIALILLRTIVSAFKAIKNVLHERIAKYKDLVENGVMLLNENKINDAYICFEEARKTAKEFHFEEGTSSFLQGFTLVKNAEITTESNLKEALYRNASTNAFWSLSGQVHEMFRLGGDYGSYAGMDFFGYHLLKAYADFQIGDKEHIESAKIEFNKAWEMYQPCKSYFPKANDVFSFLRNNLH